MPFSSSLAVACLFGPADTLGERPYPALSEHKMNDEERRWRARAAELRATATGADPAIRPALFGLAENWERMADARAHRFGEGARELRLRPENEGDETRTS